jgi:hypothetical protein
MTPKKPRPAAPGRAHRAKNSKELGGTFDPQISEETSRPQDGGMPIAQARIIVGRRSSFLYVRSCPLCGLDHTHGYFLHRQDGDPLTAFAWHGGVRASHCHCQGPGRVARFVRGEFRTVARSLPEWCEPDGSLYRLAHGPDPACFTPRAIRDAAARPVMAVLARRGVATSRAIWTPRRSFFCEWGDR